MAYTTATSSNGSYDDKRFSSGVLVESRSRLAGLRIKGARRPMGAGRGPLSDDIIFTTRQRGRHEHGKIPRGHLSLLKLASKTKTGFFSNQNCVRSRKSGLKLSQKRRSCHMISAVSGAKHARVWRQFRIFPHQQDLPQADCAQDRLHEPRCIIGGD